jgi:two-component system sensor histidine kinase DcuS
MRFSRDLVTVIGNLVDNAVDHLSQTTVAGGEVEIAVWHQDGSIRVDVSDSGDGIEPSELEAIFERGYTTKDARSHDGLGLALVSDVVHRYGGSISVDSEPGSGTLFSVNMPVARKAGLIDA